MIIGEHNLVIGSKHAIVNMFSISIFSPFEKEIYFVFKLIKCIFYKIPEKSNSPPKST